MAQQQEELQYAITMTRAQSNPSRWVEPEVTRNLLLDVPELDARTVRLRLWLPYGPGESLWQGEEDAGRLAELLLEKMIYTLTDAEVLQIMQRCLDELKRRQEPASAEEDAA